MASEVLDRRKRQRDALIARAAEYAETLCARVPLIRVTVAGSVARGDFNVWSDVDVVVMASDLPARAPERGALLLAGAPARVQPIGFTPEEHAEQLRRGNRLVVEAAELGVVVWSSGEESPPRASASIRPAERGA